VRSHRMISSWLVNRVAAGAAGHKRGVAPLK
jgi:hypothetical protein